MKLLMNRTFNRLCSGLHIILLPIALILAFPGCKEPTAMEENPQLNITLVPENNHTGVGVEQTIVAEFIGSEYDSSLVSSWETSDGTLENVSAVEVRWTAPEDTVQASISFFISDGDVESTASTLISVGNSAPSITSFGSGSDHVLIGNSVSLDCQAVDPEGFPLSYRFYTLPDSGEISQMSPLSSTATWTAPADESFVAGEYQIIVEVRDHLGETRLDTILVLVYSDDESIWVADSGRNSVSKYTANGLKVLDAEAAFLNPVAVANNIEEFYGCYVADYDGASVYKIDEEGRTLVTYANIPTVIDLAVHRETRTIWVLSAGEGMVTVIDGFQDIIAKQIYGFNQPQFVHINQASGDVWIAEPGNDRIICLSASNGIPALPDTVSTANSAIYPGSGDTPYFNTPYSPFVRNGEAQTLYVADRSDSEIERLEWNGTAYIRSNSPLALPGIEPRFVRAMTLDGTDPSILVISFSGQISRLDEAFPQNPSVVSGGYLFDVPHALAVDQGSGVCWIGDNGSNQLVKIRVHSDDTFTVLSEISGFVFIDDVVLNK